MLNSVHCWRHSPNLHLVRSARHIHATQILWKARSHTYYYDVLHITPHATHKQIKAAFYKLSKKYHPDSNKDASDSERFHEIAEAYEVLGNSLSRRKYDRGLLRPAAEETRVTDKTFHSKSYRPSHFHVGQSKHYNFDEYYKMHYGEQVLKAFVKKHRTTKHTGKRGAGSADGVKRLTGQVWEDNSQSNSATFRFSQNILVVLFLGLMWVCSHFTHAFDDLEGTAEEKRGKKT